MTTPARQELRDLIHSRVISAQREFGAAAADRITDAVMAMVYTVADDWESIDISTAAEGPGGRFLDQRWLVARIPRGSTERVRKADRSVTP